MQEKSFLSIVITTLMTYLIFTPIGIFVELVSAQKTTGGDTEQGYKFVKKWGSKGTEDGQFLRPHDLEFDKDDKYLYVVDRDGARIQVFDKNGTFLFKFGEKGKGDGQFIVP